MNPGVLYLASANPGKLREFSLAASACQLEVRVLPELNRLPHCLEDGLTFDENARKKALHYSAFTGQMVFSDDSGIIVDALGGAPGVFSARFAGPASSDAENNEKLIQELARFRGAERTAHYICAIALAQERKVLTVTHGRVSGLITFEPQGSGGFGYDPFFFYPSLAKTFAELTPDEKFAISHRGRAFRELLCFLVSPPNPIQ